MLAVDLTPIANALIALLAALITGFLIPWIRNHISTQKFALIQNWVAVAVAAAEQQKHLNNHSKKEYAVNFLMGKGIKLDSNALDAMIEAAVNALSETISKDN